MKSIIFRYYVPITAIACFAVIMAVVLTQVPLEWRLIITIVGGFLSAIYFIQKQKLEEVKLFKELFTEFNNRYDKMNDKLNRIRQGDPNQELTSKEIDVLYDYFNLCGEEYLFYKQGYIYPEVWKNWEKGMNIFCQDKRIRSVWKKEKETDSYYGLRLPECEKD